MSSIAAGRGAPQGGVRAALGATLVSRWSGTSSQPDAGPNRQADEAAVGRPAGLQQADAAGRMSDGPQPRLCPAEALEGAPAFLAAEVVATVRALLPIPLTDANLAHMCPPPLLGGCTLRIPTVDCADVAYHTTWRAHSDEIPRMARLFGRPHNGREGVGGGQPTTKPRHTSRCRYPVCYAPGRRHLPALPMGG
jgi:hypothetical protein